MMTFEEFRPLFKARVETILRKNGEPVPLNLAGILGETEAYFEVEKNTGFDVSSNSLFARWLTSLDQDIVQAIVEALEELKSQV